MSCPQCPHCKAIDELTQVTAFVLSYDTVTLTGISEQVKSWGYPDEVFATTPAYVRLWNLFSPAARCADDSGPYLTYGVTKIRQLVTAA